MAVATVERKKPRRQRGEGSVHWREDLQRWVGQIDLGKDGTGKRRRKTVYSERGETQKRFNIRVRKLRQQLDEHGDLPTSDQTVEQWLTYYLNHIAAKDLKPGAWRTYRTSITRHIVPAIGHVRLSKLRVEHIDAMHTYITDTRGLSSTTALNAHRVLSLALNEAVRRGKVPRNIAGIVRAPSKAESTREALTLDEAVRVLRVAANEPLGSTWLASFLWGTRQGERMGLRWSHLDLSPGGKADLAWALQRVGYRHGCVELGEEPTCAKKRGGSCPQRQLAIPRGMAHQQLKGSLCLLRPKSRTSTRVVAVVEPLRLALLRRLEQVERERANYAVNNDLVWCNADGSPIDPKDDWRAWTQLLVAAGVRHVTGHEARHTTATLLMEAGVDPKVIQDLLGHSDRVTTQGYQHVSLALQRQVLDQLGTQLELTAAGADASPSSARKRAPRAARAAR